MGGSARAAGAQAPKGTGKECTRVCTRYRRGIKTAQGRHGYRAVLPCCLHASGQNDLHRKKTLRSTLARLCFSRKHTHTLDEERVVHENQDVHEVALASTRICLSRKHKYVSRANIHDEERVVHENQDVRGVALAGLREDRVEPCGLLLVQVRRPGGVIVEVGVERHAEDPVHPEGEVVVPKVGPVCNR